jgi:hypothetical protein
MISKKLVLLVGIGLAVGLGALAASSGQDITGKKKVAGQQNLEFAAGAEGNPWKCEPLLVFDVSGGTLLGEVHQSLTLYNNGRVSLAEFGRGRTARNVSRLITVTEAEKFRSMLVAAGALSLTDQANQVMDVPLTTVSIFTGETDGTSHTFSYWIPGSKYAGLQQAVDAFIFQTFSAEK